MIEGLFDYLRCEGAEVDVSPDDVMRAEDTAILDILWLLMLHFCICDCELEPEEKCLAYGKLWLMDWVSEMMPRSDINPEKDELSSVFTKNHNLSELIDRVCPDSIGRSKPDKPLLNLTYALMFAEDRLSMSQNILKANEVIDGVCPDYALVIYLALLKRKNDILSSDSSTSQYGRRSNLYSDKEIIMEERSKEEILDEGEPSQYMDEEDLEERRDEGDEDPKIQKSEEVHDEISDRQQSMSMFQDASNDQFEVEADANEEIEVFESDSEGEVAEVEDKVDLGAFRTETRPMALDKGKDLEMSKIMSIRSLTGAKQQFDSCSDTVAQDDQQRLYRNECLTQDILGGVVDEDEIDVKGQGHKLEAAPVSMPIQGIQRRDSSHLSKKVGFDCGNSGSEKPLLSVSTKLSDKETLPFSSNDVMSPSKNLSEIATTKGLTTDLTDVSPGKAIDTSDEELGTLQSDATGNKPAYHTNPEASSGGKNFNPKKKFVIDGTLQETMESLENLSGVTGARVVVENPKQQVENEKGDETLKSLRLEESKTVSNEVISLNSSAVTNINNFERQPNPSPSNEAAPKNNAPQSTSLNNFSILPGRLTLSNKNTPMPKRSESPVKEKADTVPITHRSHGKTTAVSTGNGTATLDNAPLNVYESDGEKKANPLVQLRNERDCSTRSSRRGSVDSFSSESIFPIVPPERDQQATNFSQNRDSSHATPVHMYGVRASPSMDPLYQLLDRISRKGENLKNVADFQNKAHGEPRDEDNSKLDAMNGIVTNLQSQIELLGSENERLKSEIVRVNLAAETSSQQKRDGNDQSIQQQVEFLDSELAKYRSENSELKKEREELRRNVIDQEKCLTKLNRAPSQRKTYLSSSYTKTTNPLEPLIEGSHESLERSFSSPKRTPRVSLADDAIAAKEAEIARLSVELEEVTNDNNVVIGELERVKALFTRSQINELKENIDREMERAEKGESEHPQQTLQELAATIQRLEQSVASQNDSHSLHKTLINQLDSRTMRNRDATSLEARTARIKRKFNSDSLPRIYSGRIEQRSFDTEPSDFPFVKSSEEIIHKSFAPVERQFSDSGNSRVSAQTKERPYSRSPLSVRQQNFHPIKPVPVVDMQHPITPATKTSDFKTSTISLPADFSAASSPTRTLSRESTRQFGQGSDAQVQTHLSVGNQFEPHKMSMSTQTEFNTPKEDQRYGVYHKVPTYNYGPDLLGKVPPVAFPNMAVQTNNQVEEAMENLSYDTLRSYTRNLSIDAIHGVVFPEFPLPFANPKDDQRFLIESSTPHDFGSKNSFAYPSNPSYYNDGVVFRDNNVASQTYTQPTHQRPVSEAQNFGSFPADRNTMRSEFLLQPSSTNNQNVSPGFGTNYSNIAPLTLVATNPVFESSQRKQEWPLGLRGAILNMVHEEVARVSEEQKRKENLILSELALKSNFPYSNFKNSSFSAAPQPDVTFVPPIETLIMNKYKSDESWKIPPSNIGELLQYSFHGKAPMDRSFGDYDLGPTNPGYDYVPRLGKMHKSFSGSVKRKSKSNNHEHVSDSHERSTCHLYPKEHHREMAGGTTSPEMVSNFKRSSLSPYEFLSSVFSSVGVRRNHSTKRF